MSSNLDIPLYVTLYIYNVGLLEMESVSTIYLLQIENRAKTPEGAVAQPVHADTMHGVHTLPAE